MCRLIWTFIAAHQAKGEVTGRATLEEMAGWQVMLKGRKQVVASSSLVAALRGSVTQN